MEILRKPLVIYPALIILCTILMISLFRAYSSYDSPLIVYNEVLGLTTDVDGWFPIDEVGRSIPMKELSDEQKIILRDKLRNTDPVIAAKLALELGDYRLLTIYYKSKVSMLDMQCARILLPKSRLTLNFGADSKGSNLGNIFDAWRKFSVLYNYEILRSSPKEMWHDCKIQSPWAK